MMEPTHMTDALQHLDLDSLQSSVMTLADAAAEAAQQDDGGWWQAYLQLFKGALTSIHDLVDQPLRDNGITQTWGVSIALFTAAVRGSLIPVSVQQTKSAEYMKALKPYQDEIKEKFKDNQDMQNRAIAKLFEDSGQNPLAGCFVSLAQLPIFLGLYRSITLLAKEDAINEPFLWIPNLEGPVSPPNYRGMEWLTEGWHNVEGTLTPALGWETTLAFLIMPVVLVLGQSLSMQVLQPPEDENATPEQKEQLEKTQRILKFLPLMIGYFSLQVPAGLTIYWFVSNFFTVAQSIVVRKYYELNPPEIELPDYWDALDDVASMSPEEKRKAAEAGLSTGPKFSEIMDQARFHYVVERPSLREGSAAWSRAEASSSSSVPDEMKSWVGTASGVPAAEAAKV
eukprot:CAMPEP_0116012252 /NCGR_PEP_ID=MMETSP0321-20121206/5019_1 /TAXON_ID=163516 /ORGANISM="Leptocylindrus danicus var. danicus, Strain B650" /LENGTH=396 /DNA_ID=CAMNT_0003481573 /DNA_START=96 /DNA_END=1286 /DNA_ORIENTATION=-